MQPNCLTIVHLHNLVIIDENSLSLLEEIRPSANKKKKCKEKAFFLRLYIQYRTLLR